MRPKRELDPYTLRWAARFIVDNNKVVTDYSGPRASQMFAYLLRAKALEVERKSEVLTKKPRKAK